MSKRTRCLFGPVASRRLGRSLGVDLVPYKTCTLDCIYCECGKTTDLILDRTAFFPVENVIRELEERLPSLGGNIDFVTFSGSGEPLLSVSVGDVTRAIKSLTSAPVAMLTNGTLLYREDVVRDVQEIDVLIPSLDAADEETFFRINRPHRLLKFDRYLEGLRRLREVYPGRIWLEVLLVKGINDGADHLRRLGDEIRRIAPDAVQLNTVYRPGAEPTARPLSDRELADAAVVMGITPQSPSERSYESTLADVEAQVGDGVITILRRRPSRIRDLSEGLGWPEAKIRDVVDQMVRSGRIRRIPKDGEDYYHAAPDES